MPKDIGSLFEDFIKQSKNVEGKSRATIKNYCDNFGLLTSFKPDLELKDLTPKTITDFFTHLNTRERKVGKAMVIRDIKNSSIATIRSKLSAFFRWLVKNGHLKKNPFGDIPFPDVDYSDKRAFTKEQLDKIYVAVSRDIPWDNNFLRVRNLTMVMFLTLTGVRRGEFLGLKMSDIDMKNKMLTVRGETSKSKRTRRLQIHPQLIPYLENYFAVRAESDTPFLWVSNNSDRSLSSDGMKHFIDKLTQTTDINCHLHRFRHTFAVNLYLASHDVIAVMHALGHKSLKQTMVYLRSLPDDGMIESINKMVIANFK